MTCYICIFHNRPGDDALIKCGTKVYQCVVCDVGRESVTLQISKQTGIAWYEYLAV